MAENKNISKTSYLQGMGRKNGNYPRSQYPNHSPSAQSATTILVGSPANPKSLSRPHNIAVLSYQTKRDTRAPIEESSFRTPVQPQIGSGKGQSRNVRQRQERLRQGPTQLGRHDPTLNTRREESHTQGYAESRVRYEVRIGEGSSRPTVSNFLCLNIRVTEKSNKTVFHNYSPQVPRRHTSFPNGRYSIFHPKRNAESLIRNGSSAQVYKRQAVTAKRLPALKRIEDSPVATVPQQANAQGSSHSILSPTSADFVPQAQAQVSNLAELEAQAQEEDGNWTPPGLLDDSALNAAPSSIIDITTLRGRDMTLIRWLIEKNRMTRDKIIAPLLPRAGQAPDYWENFFELHRGEYAWTSFPAVHGSDLVFSVAYRGEVEHGCEPKSEEHDSASFSNDLNYEIHNSHPLGDPELQNQLVGTNHPDLRPVVKQEEPQVGGHADGASRQLHLQSGVNAIPDQIKEFSSTSGPSQADLIASIEAGPGFSRTVIGGPIFNGQDVIVCLPTRSIANDVEVLKTPRLV